MRDRACRLVAVAIVSTLATADARADHQHGMVAGANDAGEMSFGAGLALVAAQYDTMLVGGDYQGVTPSLRWSHGRFAVAASIGIYRLQGNDQTSYGPGDVMLHGHVRALVVAGIETGVALAATAPTGDDDFGFGMGHPMVMPALWARRGLGRFAVDGSVGYARAIGDASRHQDHGPWPLVEPMNVEEVTWTASGDVGLAHGIRTGARLGGGVAIGEGATRVVAGARVSWTRGRVDSAFELQAGVAGDPFIVRGVLETALRF